MLVAIDENTFYTHAKYIHNLQVYLLAFMLLTLLEICGDQVERDRIVWAERAEKIKHK